jgi:hypothetical protein
LRQAIDYWIDHRRNRVARGTLNSDRSIVKHFSAVWGDGAKLRSLADIGHVRYYQDVRLKEGIAPKTINNELLVFAGILQLAQLWHRVEPRYRPLQVSEYLLARPGWTENCSLTCVRYGAYDAATARGLSR